MVTLNQTRILPNLFVAVSLAPKVLTIVMVMVTIRTVKERAFHLERFPYLQ